MTSKFKSGRIVISPVTSKKYIVFYQGFKRHTQEPNSNKKLINK